MPLGYAEASFRAVCCVPADVLPIAGETHAQCRRQRAAVPMPSYERDLGSGSSNRAVVPTPTDGVAADAAAAPLGERDSIDLASPARASDAERLEQRLRLVVEHLPVGVWLTDRDGRIVLDNPAGARIWGRRFRERDHEGASDGTDAASGRVLSREGWSLSRALATGEPVLDEVIEFQDADGATKTIVSSVIPLRHGDGPVYGAVVVNDDVTTLRRLERRLREREERLTLAQRAGDIGTFEWFIAENRVFWTPELEALYGLPAGSFEGKYEYWSRRVHPEDLPAAEASLWEAARGGAPFHAEFRVIWPDGSERWLLGSGDLYRDASGEPSRIVGVNIDVTDRVTLERDREAALAQLREQLRVHVDLNAELRATAAARDAALNETRAALQVRDEFLSSVSHDLRTPLTALKGLAQLLNRRASGGPTVESGRLLRQLEVMEAAVDRMAGLVDDLLDLSRLESGRALDLVLEPTDLVALARRVAADHQRVSPRHTIVVEPSAAVIGVWDATRLERVLSNVVGNAVRYSPEGGAIVIAVAQPAPEAGKGWIEVRVRDDGVGIPAADLPRVFDRFHRGANVSGLVKGTGIGLATVKQIVELHGGSVAIESEEGRGTTVAIRLPIDATTGP